MRDWIEGRGEDASGHSSPPPAPRRVSQPFCFPLSPKISFVYLVIYGGCAPTLLNRRSSARYSRSSGFGSPITDGGSRSARQSTRRGTALRRKVQPVVATRGTSFPSDYQF
ncbi:hypothetical protein EVAR_67642_1 [Eumeta japonica]|uniref:Uncharacterized protein n=1 Tax=Eumeta variegata TaxID=151549 RepID=A0A4C1ZA51_EUMVA|nr:hypothetical protein EVAR_67642_1 [Eumeta japonica]